MHADSQASLQRLGTDYVDLFQCHVWDPYTPIEETMQVLDDCVRAGKVRYVGVSNWDGWQVVKANTFARQHGLTPLVSNQVWYTLADRAAEFSIVPACRDQDVSIMAWGIYAEGFLTGRYRRGAPAPRPGSRFDAVKESEMCSWRNLAVERNWATLDIMEDVALAHGKSIPNVALAWVLQSGACDVALLGASQVEQFTQSMAALDLVLRPDEVEALREASAPAPPYPMSFWDLFVYKHSSHFGGLR